MRKSEKHDPLVAEIERELAPGQFIRYDEMSDFVDGLERVSKELSSLTDKDAEKAVRLYELFLSGCYEKIEECDDSGGYFSMFFHDVFCGWIKARQAAGCQAAETIRQILKWAEHDDYGLCDQIERSLAKALNREEYQLFVAHLEALIEKAMPPTNDSSNKAIFDYGNDVRLPALSLKDLFTAKGSAAAYSRLCERLGFSPKDCEHLAEMEMAHHHWDKALTWVEKGMALEPVRNWQNECAYSLAQLKPKLLTKLGRKEDALSLAWVEFQKNPCDMAYKALMEHIPKGDRAEWHERAMQAAAQGALDDFISLCVAAKDWERLAARIHTANHSELEAVSHYQSEPAALGLAKRDGLAAAKLYRALGLRILASKKSKYYRHALKHFQQARTLYRASQKPMEWEEIVKKVHGEHSRKKGFLSGFHRIESGEPEAQPSFSERAQERWNQQMQ